MLTSVDLREAESTFYWVWVLYALSQVQLTAMSLNTSPMVLSEMLYSTHSSPGLGLDSNSSPVFWDLDLRPVDSDLDLRPVDLDLKPPELNLIFKVFLNFSLIEIPDSQSEILNPLAEMKLLLTLNSQAAKCFICCVLGSEWDHKHL